MKKVSSLIFVFFIGVTSLFAQQVTPSTALHHYLHNDDATRGWEIRDTHTIGNVNIYSILLISQKWQGILWKHELLICVPEVIEKDGALLFITGSSVKDGIPTFAKKDDGTTQIMSLMAAKNKAITAILHQVPNQPLYGDLREDALISYTLNEYKKDKDYSWPLLFPMTKSAIRAMDAIQEFVKEKVKKNISGFVVSGGSKRGWTTWLTGASKDPRVLAIAPMVIDMLNMPVTLDYQKKLYGEYSEEINDYVELDIPQAMHSEFGNAIVTMIDPYSYRKDLTLPKMIIMGTNDPYWTVDVVKHYINDIPGKNLLHYVPNAGHGLGNKVQAMGALNAFFGLTLSKTSYPAYTWSLTEKGKKINLKVQTSPEKLVKAKLWTTQSDSRDFRKSEWSSSDIQIKADKSTVETTLKYPAKGYQAFYIDLIYEDINQNEYSVSTQVYMADKKHVFLND